MARFCGVVGYAETVETSPGVWTEVITERVYRGDVTRNARRLDSGSSINDDIAVTNTISIVADAYAYQNFLAIRYVNWMGANWKVSTVDVQRPRLNLTLGGVYNGDESGSSDETE